MRSPQHVLSRQNKRSKILWCIVTAVATAVVIIIIVPTVVVIVGKDRRKYPSGIAAKVLVPLYEYPEDSAWDPLYSAIEASTDRDFIVIVNPDSGPGLMSAAPEANFAPGIQKLNNYSNVQTIGYIRTGYGSRPVQEIVQDIETYAKWSEVDASFAMHGIFFDEAAYEYNEDNLQHLYTINQFAKNSTGIYEPNTVVHNPGILPDPRLHVNNTDVTVTFEQSLKEFRKMHASLQNSPLNRTASAYIVHSAGSANLKQLVPEMSYRAAYLFVTNNKRNYYSSFGSDWQKFVDVMPTNNRTAT